MFKTTRRFKVWIGFASFGVLIALAIMLGVILSRHRSEYPDYHPLRYKLVEEYTGSDFFNKFDFFTGNDPSNGHVMYATHQALGDAGLTAISYVNASTSNALNLTYATSSSAFLRVDTSERSAVRGRMSVRVTSKSTYNAGLFLFDVAHAPYGCGTWPALWLTDPDNWPKHGEIDVMEAVNSAITGNQMTLHTAEGCRMKHERRQTGQAMGLNCYHAIDNNAGCGVRGLPDTYGQKLNENGGGIYAMEWRAEGIRTWFFRRSAVPSDVMSDSPDPSLWGSPLADFPKTDCDIGLYFKNQRIIANIDLCGDWAGQQSVYQGDQCPGSCKEFVSKNPKAFKDAYWEFASWKVFSAV